jgi:hypothetical protein
MNAVGSRPVPGPPHEEVNDSLVWRWSEPPKTFTVTRFVAVHRGTPHVYKAVSARRSDGFPWHTEIELVFPMWTACWLSFGEVYVIPEQPTDT